MYRNSSDAHPLHTSCLTILLAEAFIAAIPDHLDAKLRAPASSRATALSTLTPKPEKPRCSIRILHVSPSSSLDKGSTSRLALHAVAEVVSRHDESMCSLTMSVLALLKQQYILHSVEAVMRDFDLWPTTTKEKAQHAPSRSKKLLPRCQTNIFKSLANHLLLKFRFLYIRSCILCTIFGSHVALSYVRLYEYIH